MDNLEEIRKRKLEELQRYQQEKTEEERLQQELTQLETAVKSLMTKEALQRYGNIRAADNERATHLMVILGQLLQQGRIKQVDDATMRQVLLQMTKKKDFKIVRK
ncbi:MAG: DNA-binding protein [Candidatus Woesearchaeota archaeon]